MRSPLVNRMRTVLGVCAALAACPLVVGCQKDAQFSQKEIDQMKNPPKDMPPQARELMQKMQQGASKTPPRPVGQPGPGGPVTPGTPR